MSRRVLFFVGLFLGSTSTLFAHGPDASGAQWWREWSWDPIIVAGLFVMAAIYGCGIRALRTSTHNPKKLGQAVRCYTVGWLLLVVALLSPMHPWGQVFFSVHMVQHEVLMVLAAPLIVLGRPAPIMLSALPRSDGATLVKLLRQAGGAHAWRALTNPLIAWCVHAIALWVWHIPALFEATLTHEGVHAAQHASFLGSAVLFWQAVIYGPRRRVGYGMSIVYLFTTALHSGALGALLTFASTVWYPAYRYGRGIGGLSPLEDQQLGGLIMWIPAGVIYLLAGVVLFALWISSPKSPPLARGARSLPCAS